jgi:hypothetical protein
MQCSHFVGCIQDNNSNDYIFLAMAGFVVHYCKCVVLNGGLNAGDDICEPNYECANRILAHKATSRGTSANE